MNMGQRKKSPCEEWNLRPLDSMLRCSTTEPQRLNGEQGLLWSVKSKGLRFNSSWGLRIFSLCHMLALFPRCAGSILSRNLTKIPRQGPYIRLVRS